MVDHQRLTIKEAIEASGMSESTIRRALEQDVLKAEKIKGRWFINANDIARIKEKSVKRGQSEKKDSPDRSEGFDRVEQTDKNGLSEILARSRDELNEEDLLIGTLTEQVNRLTKLVESAQKEPPIVDQLKSENEYLREQLDHQTQLLAMSQQNLGALTEQVSEKDKLIEDLRHKPAFGWQRLLAAFGINRKIQSNSRS